MTILSLLLTASLSLTPQFSGGGASTTGSGPVAAAQLGMVDRAIFRIETESGTGSGFQYRTAGYVLTNRHVVDDVKVGGAVELRPVTMSKDGAVGIGSPIRGVVRFKHPELDVAVIEIPATVSRTFLKPHANLDTHVQRGVEVYAHGFPGITGAPGTPTVSRGLLSAHYPDPVTGQVLYLTDTALSPGNSGGPVTNGKGEVIGVATAVSIVVDGAGTSWGYVLPIRSIEEALSCSQGLAALPKPFDVSRHVSAISAAATPDTAMKAYAEGMDEAVRRCGSPDELADAVLEMMSTACRCSAPLPRTAFKSYNDQSLRAGNLLLNRLFEFALLDSGDDIDAVFARIFSNDDFSKWSASVVARTLESMPENQRLVTLAEMLSTHSAAVWRLLKSAESDCGTLQQAVKALTAKASDRKNAKAFSKSLAALVQLRLNIAMVTPDQIDPDNENLTPDARRRLTTCRASLERCQSAWDALPEDCRSVADEVLGELTSLDGSGGEDSVSPPPAVEADEPEPEGPTAMDRALELWTDSGFKRWGDVQRGVTKGTGHEFRLDFDEAPAVVWVGVRSYAADDFKVEISEADGGKYESIGAVQQGDVTWVAAEVTSDDPVSLRFDATGHRNYPFELAVLYRPSKLQEIRQIVRSRSKGKLKEATCKMLVLKAGENEDFGFEAQGLKGFHVYGVDVAQNDVDIEVLSPSGKVVARDESDDNIPVVEVRSATKGEYTVRCKNPGKTLAFIELIIFRDPR